MDQCMIIYKCIYRIKSISNPHDFKRYSYILRVVYCAHFMFNTLTMSYIKVPCSAHSSLYSALHHAYECCWATKLQFKLTTYVEHSQTTWYLELPASRASIKFNQTLVWHLLFTEIPPSTRSLSSDACSLKQVRIFYLLELQVHPT
jgi:hypothetical protein